jgi:hypothetical protein
MKPLLRYVGARAETVPSLDGAAELLWGLLQALRGALPRAARLSVLSPSYRRVALFTAEPLRAALLASGPARPGDVVPGVPPHQVVVTATEGRQDVLHLLAAVSPKGHVGAPGVKIELGLGQAVFKKDGDPAAEAERTLELLLSILGLTAARAVPGDVVAASELPRRARVGWLTFLPERLGPLPSLPPRASVFGVGPRGWIVRAMPEMPRSSGREYTDALAHLRYALGARVLLDGPTYPPPAPEVTAPAPPDIALAPAQEVPSYLKAPPATAQKRSTGDATATPVLAASSNGPSPLTPFSTGTAAIDVSKILKPAVPFEPGSPRAAAATEPRGAAPPPPQASPPAQASPPGGAQSASGTEEFNLDALMKRPRPVPFEAAAPRQSAPAATPEKPGAQRNTAIEQEAAAARRTAAQGTGPQRRLVRFDPQTGQPLAQPYWEELPPPEKKAR